MISTATPAKDRYFYGLNTGLAIAYGLANLGAILFVPLLIHLNVAGFGKYWALLVSPAALTSNGFWALQHEAIHNLFAPAPTANRRAGRIMAILFGSSFRILRFAHLTHHRFNRHPLDRPDCFDPVRSSAAAAFCYFFAEILGGLYLIEVLCPLLCWLPRSLVLCLIDRIYAKDDPQLNRLRLLAHQSVGSPRAIAEIRQDAFVVVLLYGAAVWLWGSMWWVLLAFVLCRGFLVSFLDNVYHFRTPVDEPDFAYNLQTPATFRLLILNMNFHRVHHNHMQLPWWHLPAQFAQNNEVFDANYGLAALAQLRGPATIGMLTSGKYTR